MLSKQELRQVVQDHLPAIVTGMNQALRGDGLGDLEAVLNRISTAKAPHWLEKLKQDQTLPNLDGKTIGSVIEMLFIAVLETQFLSGKDIPLLRVNPARGVDLPDLDLSIKSPSQNYCTSEPFFSAYERLLGSEFDAVVLLTDYQTAKAAPPLKLQILEGRYLTGSQLADRNLCETARRNRPWLLAENEVWAQKLFRFLAYVNQSEWLARRLVKLFHYLDSPDRISKEIEQARIDFQKANRQRIQRNQEPLPETDLHALDSILTVTPIHLGVIDAGDSYIATTHKDFARFPNENEWARLCSTPFDGQIRLSFALQWRYNFSTLFKKS